MELTGWFLDFNVPSAVWGHLRTNHTFKILLHRYFDQFWTCDSPTCVLFTDLCFETQVSKPHVQNSSTPVQTESH